jgi:hypothetical protein
MAGRWDMNDADCVGLIDRHIRLFYVRVVHARHVVCDRRLSPTLGRTNG